MDQICQKLEFQKSALLLVFMVITYYIKFIAKVANRHNNILVSLLILVTETIRNAVKYLFCKKFTLDINLPNYLFIGIVTALFLVFLRL